MIDSQGTVKGYKERIGRVALFDLFAIVHKKNRKDQEGRTIDFYSVLMLTLLFFFECMLTRKKDSSINELTKHLKMTMKKSYSLDDREYLDIAKQMVVVLRPPGGKRNRREFMNFETGQLDYVEFSYLKISGWDKNNNIQYYALDEQGLELIFATKEYFNEFQISISQLILRKQLEKGEYNGALRQVDEMRISVHTIRDKMVTIKHEIQSNIVSEEVYERYKTIISDINMRLEREHEEFGEITAFVRATKKHYETDHIHSETDQSAYEMIIKVDNELLDVHNLHSKLLLESIELKTKALEAARDTMYYVSMSSFNFSQEIVGKFISEPLPFMETKVLSKPFIGMGKYKTWSPASVFAKQRILNRNSEIKSHEFLEVVDVSNELTLNRRKETYKAIFREALKHLKTDNTFELKVFIDDLSDDMRQVRDVYEMFLILHQLSPLDVDSVKMNTEHIFSDAFQMIEESNHILEVVEMKNIIKNKSVELTNLNIQLLKKDN
jgi:hypothetical protein